MKRIFKILGLLLVIVLATQGFGFETIKAANKKISTPKVSAKVSQKKKSVKITINKTEGASWYVIEMCNTDIDTQYTKVKKLKKDGTAKRSYTKKNLEDGIYLIRVRAYGKNGKKTIKSEYSEVITVNVGKSLISEQELDYDKMIQDSYSSDLFMSDGAFDVWLYGDSTGMQGWYVWETSFLFFYSNGWYVQAGAWADWANEAGVDPSTSYISIGRWENKWNNATYSCIFDTGEMIPCFKDHTDGNFNISKRCIAYLPQVIEAVKNNKEDPSIMPDIFGLTFKPCKIDNAYIQY